MMAKTEVLSPRATRAAFFLLALLLNFTLCALFYNLEPEEEEVPLFWEEISQNIWVAVYSALLSSIPILLLSLLVGFPRRWKKKLAQAKDATSLRK